jgi:hypothetical protein
MSVFFLAFLMLLGSTSLHAASASQGVLVGCLTQLPDGALQLGAVPSGKLYAVSGQTEILKEHTDELVRLFAQPTTPAARNNASSTLMVARVQPLSKSCTSALSPSTVEAVPGKVGEDVVAVPHTTTSTENGTTAGFQTQGAAAELSLSQSVRYSHTIDQPAMPPHPEQTAESEAAANRIAASVDRTEILPGNTRGVSGPPALGGLRNLGAAPSRQ